MSNDRSEIDWGRNSFLHFVEASKRHDSPPRKPSKKPSEVIARCGDHALVRTMVGSWYDTAPVHGWTFLGRNLSERDARERWREKLKREGAM